MYKNLISERGAEHMNKGWGKILVILSVSILISSYLFGQGIKQSKEDCNKKIFKDYDSYFKNINGSAVFIDADTGVYFVYNQELSEFQTAPNSSFKIISCLMGLESGVIDPDNSLLEWDGTIYPVIEWNKNMEYRTAFKTSAIWYYRKVLDMIGPEYVQKVLDSLDYGNCDISCWQGSMDNKVFPAICTLKSINGFWQESSLKVSPIQQAEIIRKIFRDGICFSEENIQLVKEAMLISNYNGSMSIYGKTGSGIRDEKWTDAWFTGFFEYKEMTMYFSIRLNEPGTSGQQAKEIAIDIIYNEFGR